MEPTRARDIAPGSLEDMKRSEALKVLSHQHHHGLFAALQLKRAGAHGAGGVLGLRC